jgi:sporulation protein YlmC with PRC-barrel domain
MRQELLVGFHLLDRQVLDRDGRPLGKVDDVEFAIDGNGQIRLAALLLGPQALGERLGSRLGRLIADAARRLHPAEHPDPVRVPYEWVADIGSAVALSVPYDRLPEPTMEAWLREHVIDKIPGASRGG